MKQQLNEIKRMQQLAGLKLNEASSPRINKIDFGPFKNVEVIRRFEDNTAHLNVLSSDNFTKEEQEYVAINYDSNKDYNTEEDLAFFDKTVEDIAQDMSNYLTRKGIENEIVDNPIGYGQEIINLEVVISLNDLDNLTGITSGDDDTWTDPAGGTHYGDEDDPAAMYK